MRRRGGKQAVDNKDGRNEASTYEVVAERCQHADIVADIVGDQRPHNPWHILLHTATQQGGHTSGAQVRDQKFRVRGARWSLWCGIQNKTVYKTLVNANTSYSVTLRAPTPLLLGHGPIGHSVILTLSHSSKVSSNAPLNIVLCYLELHYTLGVAPYIYTRKKIALHAPCVYFLQCLIDGAKRLFIHPYHTYTCIHWWNTS